MRIRVQQNSAYITVILLARVIVQLGDLKYMDTSIIEALFATDFNYLQEFYHSINGDSDCIICPKCGEEIKLF